MSSLYGIGGRLTAGKDVFADRLVDTQGFIKLNMSTPLLAAMLKLDPWINLDMDVGEADEIWYQGEHIKFSQLLNLVGYVDSKNHKDVRDFLQKLGTEVGRHMFGDNVWVDMAKNRIRKLLDDGKNVVITGIRFQNELDMIFDLGGVSIWVERPSLDESSQEAHKSENSLGADDFERIIYNDGTLDDFLWRADIFHQALTYSGSNSSN